MPEAIACNGAETRPAQQSLVALEDDSVHGLEPDGGGGLTVVQTGLGTDMKRISYAGPDGRREPDINRVSRGQGHRSDVMPLVAVGRLIQVGAGHHYATGYDLVGGLAVPDTVCVEVPAPSLPVIVTR